MNCGDAFLVARPWWLRVKELLVTNICEDISEERTQPFCFDVRLILIRYSDLHYLFSSYFKLTYVY